MNEIQSLLKECGLTQNEALVYLALLRLGKAKSGQIVKEAKISGGKIYETLYKLLEKGLVKIAIENGIKNFIANNPATLQAYLKEREEELKKKETELSKKIPELESIRSGKEELENVSLLKGMRGIKELVYSKLIKAKNTIKIMGLRSSKDERYNLFWRQWHTERVKMKKNAQAIFSDRGTDYWRFFKNLKNTQTKSLLHLSPSAIMIIDNSAFIFTYEPDFSCININQAAITSSFSNFFDDLWKIAKL